jgi:hypothetical protein
MMYVDQALHLFPIREGDWRTDARAGVSQGAGVPGLHLAQKPESVSLAANGFTALSIRHVVNDQGRTWRLMYRIDVNAILILAVFAKKTERTPDEIIRSCQKRLKDCDNASRKAKAPRS